MSSVIEATVIDSDARRTPEALGAQVTPNEDYLPWSDEL